MAAEVGGVPGRDGLGEPFGRSSSRTRSRCRDVTSVPTQARWFFIFASCFTSIAANERAAVSSLVGLPAVHNLNLQTLRAQLKWRLDQQPVVGVQGFQKPESGVASNLDGVIALYSSVTAPDSQCLSCGVFSWTPAENESPSWDLFGACPHYWRGLYTIGMMQQTSGSTRS